MSKYLSEEEFFQRFKDKYGDKYDLSKFEYIDSKTKSIAICHKKDINGKEHGEFLISPNHLLTGRGCAKCGGNLRLTKDVLLERIIENNVNNFQYEIPEIINSKSKVKFICDKGHVFKKYPYELVTEIKCPICNPSNTYKYDDDGNAILNPKLSTEEFIQKSKEIWGDDAFDYSNVIYKDCDTEIELLCLKHNEVFHQTPYNHLKCRCGCKKCAKEKQKQNLSLDFDEFVKKAREIHGDKYKYIKDTYSKANGNVDIICPIHGKFTQNGSNHIYYKAGCPKCNMSHLEEAIYVLLDKYKINNVYQFNDKWLGKQTLDFLIPSKNIAIECQGEQHFRPKSFGCHDEQLVKENFEKQIERDNRKKELCKENGIELVYFLDKEYNKYLMESDIFFNDVDELVSYLISK